MAFAGRGVRDEECREEVQRGYFNILQVTITAYFGKKRTEWSVFVSFFGSSQARPHLCACIFGCNASRVEKQDVERDDKDGMRSSRRGRELRHF